MPDFTKLWDIQYLFGPNPPDPSRSDNFFFWIAAAFVVLAVIFKILVLRREPASPTRHLLSRFFHLFLTVGILVLIWFGARTQDIPWVSARFLALALLALWAVWLGFILRYYFRDWRPARAAWEEESLKKKYLP